MCLTQYISGAYPLVRRRRMREPNRESVRKVTLGRGDAIDTVKVHRRAAEIAEQIKTTGWLLFQRT